MEKARRRQVPAFGEWNYCYQYQYAEPPAAAAQCYAPEPETEACSDVWFRYSPPPRKPTPRKMRRPEGDEKGSRRPRASATGNATATARGASASRVVRPVDVDLYQVPPPELISSHRPRRKRTSLLMGCLGLNSSCVA